MARPVDERIVKLSLDNNQFKSRASESTGILSKLGSMLGGMKNLNLSKSVQELDNVNKKASGVSLDGLKSAAEAVTSRFSVLGQIASTALTNITNRAVDAGVRMAKSLSVQGAIDGFGEYELKMKSIQTILANTQGKSSLEDVKGVLEELNTYADQTVYSFADMTSNIGTFTAAGVGLKDSATAIKGISNLAAASGSNTQQASTAMYQLSQALANGKVNLQDWNSVVNAGMGGKLFQDALMKNAEAMGINVDRSKAFRETLQDGWLTTDVLIDTLGKFAEDKSMLEAATKVRTFTQMVDTAKEAVGSGWATTWELLFGDFEEAGVMWTKANDVISASIDKSSKSRNELIKSFVDMGGRTKLIDSVANSFKALSQVVSIGKSAFKEIFPPVTAKQLFDMASKLAEFTKNLSMSSDTANKVKSIFKGLFSILDIGLTVIKMVAKAFTSLIPSGLGSDLLGLAAKLGDLITNFSKAIKTTEGTNEMFGKIKSGANDAYQSLKQIGSFIVDLFTNTSNAVKKLYNFMKPLIDLITNGFKEMFSGLGADDFATGGVLVFLFTTVKKLSGLGDKLNDFIGNLSGVVDKAKESFSVFTDLGDALKSLTGAVKAGTLVAIAGAILLLAISLNMISKLEVQDISKSLFTIGAMMMMLNVALTALSKNVGGVGKAMSAAIMLTALAAALLLMSASLKILEGIKPEDLAKGLAAMAGMITMLVLAIKSLSKNQGGMMTGSVSLLALATSILIMSSAVKKLASIDSEGLIKGITALGVIFLELAVFMKIVDRTKLGPGSATGLLITSAAILVMVEAIRQIAAIDVNMLVKGLATIGAILLEFAIFNKISGSSSLGNAAGMLIMAGAINALVGPINAFGAMDMVSIAKGLGVIAVALLEMVVAMNASKGGIAGALAVTVMAGALNLLVPVLKGLGSMSLGEIAKGLITMGGALGIVALAANLIGPMGSVALLAFAAAITAVGLAAGLVAGALFLFTTALTALSQMTKPMIDNIIAALSSLITGITNLIPQIITTITVFVLAMVQAMVDIIPAIAEAGLQIILGLLTALRDNLPQIVTVGYEIITKLIEAIGEKVPELIEAGAQAMIKLINGLANTIRDHSEEIKNAIMNLIEAILELLIDALSGIVEAIFGWIPGVNGAVQGVGDAAKEGLRSRFSIEDGKKIGSDAGSGYVQGVNSKTGEASSAGNAVASNAKSGAGTPNLLGEGLNAGGQYVTGVNNKTGDANAAGTSIGTNAKTGAGGIDLNGTGLNAGGQYVTGVTNKNGAANTAGVGLSNNAKTGADSVDVSSSGTNFGQGFADGISGMWDTVSKAASGLADMAKGAVEKVLAIFSPSRVMRKDGGYFGEGFALGIDDQGRNVQSSAKDMALGAKDALTSTLEGLETILSNDIEPTITPVLDLSNLDQIPDLSKTSKLMGNFQTHVIASGVTPDRIDSLKATTESTNTKKLLDKIDAMLSKMDAFIDSMPETITVQSVLDSQMIGEKTAPITKEFNARRQRLLDLVEGRG